MSELRQKVDKLRKYPIFKLFHFIELAYLSQFYQQKTFGYKDYLYTQGSVPNEIYLIEQGQFQFTLFLEDNEENQIRNKLKQKLARNKSLSKQKNDPIDFQEPSFYNKIKPTKINEFKVGTVSGGMGQFIGMQEIILSKDKRKYNAKCASTHNHVIVIKKQHLIKVLNRNPQLMSKLKHQLTERQKITHEAHQKLCTLRTNRDSLVKLLVKQTSRERNITVPTEKLDNGDSLKLPLLQRKNQTEMKKKQKPFLKQKLHIRASNDSLLTVDRFDDLKGSTLLMSQPQMSGETFMLTAFDQPGSELLKKHQTKLNKLSQLSIDKIEQFEQEKMKLSLKSSKSQNTKQMSPQKFSPKKKHGVIDTSSLVREKQRIVQMRKTHNQICDRVQFQQKYLKAWKKNMLDKERGKQSSTAHSKHFMEKMLLTALKKAGYQEETSHVQKDISKAQHKKTSSVEHLETQNSIQDQVSLINQTKNLKLEKLALKLKKKRKAFFEPVSQILESNPFDECYFKKMN